MASTIVVCIDGSELAVRAAQAGLAVLKGPDDVHVVTVAEGLDPSLAYDGSGHAGPSMSVEELEDLRSTEMANALEIVERAVTALGLDASCGRVIEGPPGPALCDHARAVRASAVVIGSRGRGGIKRALLGSVSDFVVRNAPCPVVVTGDAGG
jgi:nucleotide-binding universal stress UspA family protein